MMIIMSGRVGEVHLRHTQAGRKVIFERRSLLDDGCCKGEHAHSVDQATITSEVLVLVDGELHLGGLLQLGVHGLDLALVDGDLGGLQDGGLNKGQVGVTI